MQIILVGLRCPQNVYEVQMSVGLYTLLIFVLGVPSALLMHGARCSSVVRAFAHGAMGHQIDPSWGGPIELFLIPASAQWLV